MTPNNAGDNGVTDGVQPAGAVESTDATATTDATEPADAAGAADPVAPASGYISATQPPPPPGRPKTKTRRAPWTLRRRLVVAVVALLALVSLAIGAVSVTILRASLLDGLDAQLVSASDRSQVVLDGRVHGTPGSNEIVSSASADDILNGPAQQPGTLALVFDGATVTAGYTDNAGTIQNLTADEINLLIAKASTQHPVSVDFGGSLGDYRVIVGVTPFGNAYIIGLPLASVNGTVGQLGTIITLVSMAGLLVVALLAAWIVRLALRPLTRVTETATRVAELPLDKGEVELVERVKEEDADPRTEVGRVGAALNRMLDHVDVALETRHASERKVRQFVADASHELRTPLASIRGYSELTRRTGEDLPADAVHALDRIESESVRMTGLVEDLLLLARLDEGRELERDPVDLTLLLIDAVSDAHAAGPDHTWDLDLPEEPIEIVGDSAKLHQVLTNLLANARVHTPAGTTVTAALSTEDDRAIITVTDDGPGIPTELKPSLFERFARGDTSRYRGASTGSTGLGLAIVQAVVTAHHGRVTVQSEPGMTQFRVELPIA